MAQTATLGNDLTTTIPIRGQRERARQVPRAHAPTVLNQLAQNLCTGIPLLVMDCVGLSLSMILASTVVTLLGANSFHLLPSGSQLVTNGVVYLLVYALLGLYPGVGLNPIVELRNLVMGTLTAGAVLLAALFTFDHFSLSHTVFTLGITALGMILVPLFRCSSRELLASHRWWTQPALVVGSGEDAVNLMATLRRKQNAGLRPVGIVDNCRDPQYDLSESEDYLGTIDRLADIAAANQAHWALISMSDSSPATLAEALRQCASIPNTVVFPRLEPLPSLWTRSQDLGGIFGVHVREQLLSPISQFGKRLFDIIAATSGLILLSPFLIPFLAFTWLCIRRCSPGPMFYANERVGKNGKRFKAWKFRSMVLNAEQALGKFLDENPSARAEWEEFEKLRDDPRVIPGIGAFLRKSSLDELPQLWNILRGEMSLIGPRPIPVPELDRYAQYADAMNLYLQVHPGLTGLWQISGRNLTTQERRVELDAYYVRNWSIWLDIFILARTVRTVVMREGAF